MTLYSSDLLHPPNIIDQAYETRQLLAHGLASQWSGINIIARHPSDNWLVVGLALHMTSLFLKSLWGANEYRFKLKKDVIRCVAQDVQREPMSVPARHTQPESEQMQFIALKAPLVLHILDKHLRKSGTSLGLDKVLPKLFLDAITGDISTGTSAFSPTSFNTIGTNQFIRICRKACGGSSEVLKSFFDQWVYGSGCPTFVISAQFNRKKMAIELSIQQDCRAATWASKAPWTESSTLRAMPAFEGQMTIRIHEADGTPYEHVLNIQDTFKKHEVPFNTKYKRVRRNTKRYQARQAAATAAAQGDAEAQEDMGMIDLGFNLSMWEDEKERERWRVADWTEEDDVAMSQATYEWIRIDADLEWICAIEFEQPDFMWLSQLQRDRDVVAQLEAVHAMSRMPSAIVSSNLTKTVLVSNYFFRIRTEACLALIACATKSNDYLGLFHLLKLFQTRYCFDPESETKDPLAFRCVPKANDFRDLTEYFLKRALVTAISMVRDEKGQTPPVVSQLLLDLLMFNDNLGNPFSDTFYIVTIMNALGHAFVAVHAQEHSLFSGDASDQEYNEFLDPSLVEVERLVGADRLVPSYHNAISVAGIELKLKLTMASLIPEDMRFFVSYTRDGNYPPVRIAAFEAIVLLNAISLGNSPLLSYLFAVLQRDSSLLVRRRLAQALLQSLPILSAVQDLAPPDAFVDDGQAYSDIIDHALTRLRKVPGRSNTLRYGMLAVFNDPDVDSEVRMTLLKICETTVRPHSEPIPKIVFRVPSLAPETPLASTPLTPLPKLKLTSSSGPSAPLPKITIPRRESLGPAAFDEFPLPPPEPVDAPVKTKKIKIKAPAKLLPAQASGMSMTDVTICQSLLSKLMKNKSSTYFRAPVDPIKSNAPRYFEIITDPMDLSTMGAKLQAGQYRDREAFRADFRLIVANAKAYNVAGHVVDEANNMAKAFEKQWKSGEATLLGVHQKAKKKGYVYELEPNPVASTSAVPYTNGRHDPITPSTVSAVEPSQSLPKPSFKITLGGSSSIAANGKSASPTPQLTSSLSKSSSKPPKPTKTASFADEVEYARPTPPIKLKFGGGSAQLSALDATNTPTSKSKKPSKDKAKDKPKEREKVKVNYVEQPVTPIDAPPLPPVPPPVDLPPLPHPTRFFGRDEQLDRTKAKAIVKNVSGMREAFFFLYPVDAVSLPTYYEEIEHPMDLSSMSSKIDNHTYRTFGELFDDFDLIVRNCNQFNPPNTEPVSFVAALDRAWRSDWDRASKLGFVAKRSLLTQLKALMKEGCAYPFLESIELVLDQIPDYPRFVPRENWRHLNQIRGDVEKDTYRSLDEVDVDIQLMLNNCYTYNGHESQVSLSGKELQQKWAKALAKVKSEAGQKGKRPGGDKVGGVAKRQKV